MVGQRFRAYWPVAVLAALILIVLAPSLIQAQAAQPLPAADDPKELFKQAREEDRKWRFDNAEKLYRQAIELDAKYTDAHLALAYVLARKRLTREAYDIAFRIAQADPENARAFAVLGATLLISGNFADARRCFDKSLSLNHKDDLAFAGIGLLDFYQNQIENSLYYLEEASFRDPDEPDY